MTDDPLTHDRDGRAGRARLQPVAIHFKGKGFYNTDYGTKKRNREKASEKSSCARCQLVASNSSDSSSSSGVLGLQGVVLVARSASYVRRRAGDDGSASGSSWRPTSASKD